MLLSVLQANASVMDVEANLRTIDDAAQRAAQAGSGLLLTPELFPVGYAPVRLHAELDPSTLPGIRERLAGIARTNGIGLVYSLPAPAAGNEGSWHITATLLDAEATRSSTTPKCTSSVRRSTKRSSAPKNLPPSWISTGSAHRC